MLSDRRGHEPRELTGRRVLAIALACFGVVIAANLAMLAAATGSFPGLVVESAYREGVGWDDRAAAQTALGWDVKARYAAGELAVEITGPRGPVREADLALTVGRPATDRYDVALRPAWYRGAWRTPAALDPGIWRVELRTLDESAYAATFEIVVPDEPR